MLPVSAESMVWPCLNAFGHIWHLLRVHWLDSADMRSFSWNIGYGWVTLMIVDFWQLLGSCVGVEMGVPENETQEIAKRPDMIR